MNPLMPDIHDKISEAAKHLHEASILLDQVLADKTEYPDSYKRLLTINELGVINIHSNSAKTARYGLHKLLNGEYYK